MYMRDMDEADPGDIEPIMLAWENALNDAVCAMPLALAVEFYEAARSEDLYPEDLLDLLDMRAGFKEWERAKGRTTTVWDRLMRD